MITRLKAKNVGCFRVAQDLQSSSGRVPWERLLDTGCINLGCSKKWGAVVCRVEGGRQSERGLLWAAASLPAAS